MKEKIEKEINEINVSYDKIFKEVTQSYEKKHEKLTKEEYVLKEDLQNEVTKAKEKLENYLSELSSIIRINEKILKGIKLLEKEEKNMIKTLSYVSKINKNKKEMNELFAILMKNIKISFEEENNKIKYDNYYFNGIQIPKNIEFKDISSNSLKIYWNIDNINNINIDKEKIKYKVEIKKENEKFVQKYEGNNNNCLIENLSQNTEYEIRIGSFYNEIEAWSEVKKIRTLDIDLNVDSNILDESKKNLNIYEKYMNGVDI